MWDKLQKQVAVEREQLNSLLQIHQSLLSQEQTPNAIELSALAAMLHSLYTGIENIFKRIAVERDSGPPRNAAWHRQLLESMTQANQARPAVISQRLRETLRGYLDFRHVFRQAYTFELRWEKMAELVKGCESTLRQLEQELDLFWNSLDKFGNRS